MESSEFLWTMPCYILATNFTRNPETGDVVFDDNIRIVAPEKSPGGEKRIAIFTDSHLAQEYLEQSDPALNLSVLEFRSPVPLKSFLENAQHHHQYVVVDLNRKTRIGRNFLIQELLPELDRWINYLNNQENSE